MLYALVERFKMMREKRSSYKWTNQSERTVEIWSQLFTSNKFTDVTLICNDQQTIQAHRLILSACSPIFNKILDQNSSSNPWIYLRGIDYEEMKAIIQFIYLGTVTMEDNKVNEFFEIAEDLEIASIINSQKGNIVDEIKQDLACGEQNISTQNEDFGNITDQTIIDNEPTEEDEVEYENTDNEMETSSEEVPNTDTSQIEEEFPETPKEPEVVQQKKTNPQSTVAGYQCNMCSAKFTSRGGVELHIKLKHGPQYLKPKVSNWVEKVDKENQIESQENNCNESSSQSKQEKKQNASPQKEQERNTMLKALKQKLTLNSSWELIDGIYYCKVCEDNFESKVEVQSHFTSVHENVKNNINANKKKSSKIISDMQPQNKTLPETVTPTLFKCNLCDYRANQKAHLKVHILQVHIGKTFTCVKCNFSTKQKILLKAHLKDEHPLKEESKVESIEYIE